MKKCLFVSLVIVALLGFCLTAYAGDYPRRGTIHLALGGWAQSFNGNGATHLIAPTNRGDKPIRYHIDFYVLNEDGTDTVVGARIPASGEITVPPHWSDYVVTTNNPLLDDITSVMSVPVVVWAGRVDVPPSCYVELRDYVAGEMVSVSRIPVYDDMGR